MNHGDSHDSRASDRPQRRREWEHDILALADLDREGMREPIVPRLFLREPGWHVRVKDGSARMFCHVMSPGEEFYHRIADCELYLQRGEEKICLRCADRHGLFDYRPKALKPAVRGLDVLDSDDLFGYPLCDDPPAHRED